MQDTLNENTLRIAAYGGTKELLTIAKVAEEELRQGHLSETRHLLCETVLQRLDHDFPQHRRKGEKLFGCSSYD